MIIDKTAGRTSAWLGLVFGAGLSLLGNIAHTCLADTKISLGLRLPVAVAWPIALLVSIEILVRVNWRRAWLDNIGKLVLWAPVGAVAAVVSYRHMHSLLVMSGEDPFSALVGPLAVDGLMIGSTIALLIIRALLQENDALEMLPENVEMEHSGDAMDRELEQWLADAPTEDAPVSPATAPILTVVENAPEKPRRPRGEPDPRQMDAARLIVAGADRATVLERSGVSPAVYGRLGKVWRMLRSDINAEISGQEKVHIGIVDYYRECARAEASR